MSRAQIADVVRSGQLTESELRKYVTTYQEKLARPFACFVFMLIALPFGLRAVRAAAAHGPGLRLVAGDRVRLLLVMTICSFLGEAFLTSRAVGVDAEPASSPLSACRGCGARRRYSDDEFRRDRSRHRYRPALMADRRRGRVRRRPRRPSGRPQAAHAVRNSSAVHVDDHRHRNRHAHRAGRHARRDFRSQQVKTAFFKLNSINQQIAELTSRERNLETKVNTGRLIVPVT